MTIKYSNSRTHGLYVCIHVGLYMYVRTYVRTCVHACPTHKSVFNGSFFSTCQHESNSDKLYNGGDVASSKSEMSTTLCDH